MATSSSSSPTTFPQELTLRYAPIQVLGHGGYGTVFLAEDKQLHRKVALKLLNFGVGDQEILKRFQREARVTSSLNHPAIVKVYDSGVSKSRAYIVYEYVEGPTLAEAASERKLTCEQISAWGKSLAEALHLAHRSKILHRDVKPANVILRNGEEPVLCDFGIARSQRRGTAQTAAGLLLGTPGYMAPELFLGQPPSPASDQFGLAATLYDGLFRSPVFGTQEISGVLDFVRANRTIQIPETLKEQHPALYAVLTRALQSDPAKRFASLREFQEAFHTDHQKTQVFSTSSALQNATVQTMFSAVDPSPPKSPSPLPSARLPWIVGSGFLLLTLFLGWSFSPTTSDVPRVAPSTKEIQDLNAYRLRLMKSHNGSTLPELSPKHPFQAALRPKLSDPSTPQKMARLVEKILIVRALPASEEKDWETQRWKALSLSLDWLRHELFDRRRLHEDLLTQNRHRLILKEAKPIVEEITTLKKRMKESHEFSLDRIEKANMQGSKDPVVAIIRAILATHHAESGRDRALSEASDAFHQLAQTDRAAPQFQSLATFLPVHRNMIERGACSLIILPPERIRRLIASFQVALNLHDSDRELKIGESMSYCLSILEQNDDVSRTNEEVARISSNAIQSLTGLLNQALDQSPTEDLFEKTRARAQVLLAKIHQIKTQRPYVASPWKETLQELYQALSRWLTKNPRKPSSAEQP